MVSDLNESALTAAHIAVEDMLVELRDQRISMMNRNGFVIYERDGSPSSIIRLGTRVGLEVGIRAYLKALDPDEAKRVIDGYMDRVAAERATHSPLTLLARWADDFARSFYAEHADKLLEVPTVSVREREDGAIVVRLGDLVFRPGVRL